MIRFIQNRNFILVLALLLGILAGDFAVYFKDYSLYVLAFMMIVSLNSFSFAEIKDVRLVIRPVLISIVLNYFLFGILILAFARLFYLPDDDVFKGFVFIVIAPPGAVIVPFTAQYGGNSKLSVYGVIGASLFLLILFPLVAYLTLGSNISGSMFSLFKILAITIIIPLILSQLTQKIKIFNLLTKYKGRIIDWSFFIIVYIVIGLNRNTFINQTEVLILPTLLLFIFIFGFGFVFNKILLFLKINTKDRLSYSLLFLVKNNPFSAVISLQLAGKVAAIPSVALSVVLLFYLMLFPIISKKNN